MKKKEKNNQLFQFVFAFTIFFLIHELCSVMFGVKFVNYGISFGIFSNNYSSYLLPLVALFIISIWFFKNKNIYLQFVIIGAIINIIDRFRFGGVRDYWTIPFTTLFNNSNDYLIFLSLIVYCKDILWKKK